LTTELFLMSDLAAQPTPIILIPGLNCSARLYAEQVPVLWRFGPVTVADHRRDDSIAAMARRILADGPPRFALAGLSMGGYIALEIMRQAPGRAAKLALLDTGPGPELPERTAQRKPLIELARQGRFGEVTEDQFPWLVHHQRHGDAALKAVVRAMNEETGPDAYIRQQQAIMARPDSRPGLQAIACSTVVLVGDDDRLTPPELSREMAAAIPGARLVVIPDSGHLSTMEQPAAVNRALVEWMKS
jgi:pimeloyl-ACP methyl ester carboxylesterase